MIELLGHTEMSWTPTGHPQRLMARVSEHFRLPPMQYDTRFAYNTRAKRGLKWWGRSSATRREPKRAAARARAPPANVSDETMRLLREATADSVRRLDEALRADQRPGVPDAWRDS